MPAVPVKHSRLCFAGDVLGYPRILMNIGRMINISKCRLIGNRELNCRQILLMSQDLWIKMANLVFELEKKLSTQQVSAGIARNIDRMKAVVEEAGLLLLNPTGEAYAETRTDLEASITGSASGTLTILDVIKPIVYFSQDGRRSLLQKGVVIVGQK
jgi:hypothetical protein